MCSALLASLTKSPLVPCWLAGLFSYELICRIYLHPKLQSLRESLRGWTIFLSKNLICWPSCKRAQEKCSCSWLVKQGGCWRPSQITPLCSWLQVSATFAASLVTSPAIGAYLGRVYGDSLVVVLATAIALLDICFILVAVPESLPEKMRPASWGAPISWEQADPFASLKKVGQDSIVLLICITVFLSYLPEAGQYSSFFLYLRQIMKFSPESVAAFIAVLGILSIIAQTIVLSLLMRSIGNKNTILLGLGFQILQLAWYGFGSEPWMMWAAGAVAAMSSITFPAVSALVSRTADADQQGVVQGMITGIRGLCNGLGPALYGFIFYIFHVELKELPITGPDLGTNTSPQHHFEQNSIIPGPPFLFGACSVLLALLVALFIPEHTNLSLRSSSWRKHCGGHSHPHSTQAPGEAKEPLLQDTNVWLKSGRLFSQLTQVLVFTCSSGRTFHSHLQCTLRLS